LRKVRRCRAYDGSRKAPGLRILQFGLHAGKDFLRLAFHVARRIGLGLNMPFYESNDS
jgi:hypothetical protein